MLPFRLRHIAIVVLLPLFLYMSVYTWNWKTGQLDRLARYTGLEIVGTVLSPGKWVHRKTVSLWESYVHLTGVQRRNDVLQREVRALKLKNMHLREQARATERLRRLMHFTPPADWTFQGADIIGNRVGPNAVLQTLIMNKGAEDGIVQDTPVLTPDGLVGRVNQVSPHYSTILLITDPNSNIPVRGQRSRTDGILCGQGPRQPLRVKHVPQNSPLYTDELLVTSGLAGLFPEGLAVARVRAVSIKELSLFKEVQAKALVDLGRLEEVLALMRPAPDKSSSPVPAQ